MRTLNRLLTASALTVVAMLGFAAPAQAVVYGDYTDIGIRIRRTPCTCDGRIDGLGYPGQGATIYCWQFGTNIGGNNHWNYHTNRTTGVTGYSSDYYMTWGGTTPLERC